jgi:hypothetical protein
MQRKVMLGTALLWVLATIGGAAHRILALCSFPAPPDEWEKRWDYQLTIFLILELPWRLLGLGLALGLMCFFFARSATEPAEPSERNSSAGSEASVANPSGPGA